MDREILEAFSQEVIEISHTLKGSIQGIIKTKMKEGRYFEQYGQAIDRIYGTAMTIGMKEIGEYARAMKALTYKCSASDNEVGREKATYLMIEGLKYLESIPTIVNQPTELGKIKLKMGHDVIRAEKLSRQYFFSINKTSCD